MRGWESERLHVTVRRLSVLWVVCCGLMSAQSISIQPAAVTVNPGQAIVLNINAAGITDLYAFQFDVGFNKVVVSASSVVEGGMFSSVGLDFMAGNIDNTTGT